MSLAFCNDRPITTAAEDAFGFRAYAVSLSHLALAGDSPLTIGIFGPAGSGKTSLLHLIATALEEHSAVTEHPILMLRFDAARHAPTALPLPHVLLLQALGAFSALDLAPKDAQQLADWEVRLAAAADLGALVEAFPSTFARWLRDYLGARGGRRAGRFAVFLDGLDDCPAERAIDVLEAARHFLCVHGSLCFLAADRDRLKAALNARYGAPSAPAEDAGTSDATYASRGGTLVVLDGGTLDAGTSDATYASRGSPDPRSPRPGCDNPYLDRLVQVAFALPPLSSAHGDAFLARLAPDLPAAVRHVLTVGLPSTPRRLKQSLNALRLRQALAQSAPDAPEAPNPILLSKIVVLQERHPELWEALAEHPRLLQELEMHVRSAQSTPESTPEGVPKGVLESPTLPLPLARYAAEPLLARVLEAANPITDAFAHLAPHELRACLGLADGEYSLDRQMWDDLLSGNIARLHAAVENARQSQPAYSHALVRFMHRAQPAAIAQRLSAGLALGRLGDPRDFAETVLIPAGEFFCGVEKRPCVLPAYRIGRYPVTQAQYATFLQAHPAFPVPYVDEDWARVYNWAPETRTYPAGRSNQPVVLVTWDEAAAYCAWAGGRLPAQEEWERAARGDDGRSYPWGEAFAQDRANTRESALGGPTPVGVFVAGESPGGALDMAGNVWEWTASDHDANAKILRGGAWNFPAESAFTFASERSRPHNRSHAIGFRAVFPT